MTTQVDDTALIELIYAALLGESSWQAFLDRLAQAAPGCWSVLHSNSAAQDEAVVGLISGRSLEDVASYAPYYHAVSPWVAHCNIRPGGKVTIVEDYVSAGALERSEFYTDFLRPIGTRSSIGVGMGSEDSNSVLISLMTPDACEEKMRRLAAQIQRITPHLRRATEFYRRTSFAARSTELGATFFDSLHMGMVVVGAGRRIRTCSDLARRLFGADVGLDPLGRLRLGDPMAQAMLEAMLRRDWAGPQHRRLIVGQTLVTLIRMEGERERSFFEGPGVCLTLEPLARSRAMDLERFAMGYGLTPGEIRVLEGLVAGKTLAEIAREAQRSRETIRSQLKSLCARTGARGQSDLLRMVAGMVA